MEDTNFHKQFGEGDKTPIPIPPGDNAWNDMRNRLDAGMPEEAPAGGNTSGKKGTILKWFTGLVVLFFISWVVLTQLPPKKRNEAIAKTDSVTNNHINNNNKKETAINQPGDVEKQSQSGAVKDSNTGSHDKEMDGTAKSLNEKSDSIGTASKPPVAGIVPEEKIDAANPIRTKKYKSQKDIPAVEKKTTNRRIVNKNTTEKNAAEKNKQVARQTLLKVGRGNKKNSITTVTPQATKNEINLYSTTVITDNSNAAVVNRHLPATLASDTASAVKTPDAPSALLPAIKIQGGLQWNLQLPSGSAGNYFTGAKGQSEPYRVLLPAAWLTFQYNKSLFSVEVNPFFTATVPAKSYESSTSGYRVGDTVFSNTETKTLRKLFGISAALGYSHNISGDWWAGGSIRSNWWQKGVAISQLETLKRSDSGRFNDIRSTNSQTLLLKDSSWTRFSKMQFVINADIWYKRPRWQAGLQVGVPLVALTKRDGPRNPLYAAVLFRLAIPGGNRKK